MHACMSGGGGGRLSTSWLGLAHSLGAIASSLPNREGHAGQRKGGGSGRDVESGLATQYRLLVDDLSFAIAHHLLLIEL
jgi:hypothetical protein